MLPGSHGNAFAHESIALPAGYPARHRGCRRPAMKPRGGRAFPRAAVAVAAAGLLLAFAIFCHRAAEDTSATFDEPIHLLAAHSYWAHGVPETLTANLRASQLWIGIPLTLLDLHYPEILKPTPGVVVDVDLRIQREFLHDPRHDPANVLRTGRAAITVLGVILGLVLFTWSRRLFGDAAGLLTLGLYCFEPTVIAHSSLATTDIAATLAFTLAVAAWWRLLHRAGRSSVVLCGLTTGLVAATKISFVLLVPAVLLMALVRFGRGPAAASAQPKPAEANRWPLPWAVVGSLALAYVVIWGIYGFRYTAGWRMTDSAWSALFVPQAGTAQRLLNFFRLHRLLPEAYLYDCYTFLNNLGGRRAYLLGKFSMEGWWFYFPVVGLAKTSLATLSAVALTGVGLSVALVRKRVAAADFYGLAPLLIFAAVYTGSAVAGPLNIGLRHLLPAYPALFVAAGLGVKLMPDEWRRFRGWSVAVLIAVAAGTAWSASPHFLSFYNSAAGGPVAGHRISVDSNYDWGQDLPKIARWLEARAAAARTDDPVFLAYYGLGDPARYGIRARLLPQSPDFRPVSLYDLQPGDYVISATLLQGLAGQLVWGPWRPSLERVYRALADELAPFYTTARTAAASTPPAGELAQKIALFDELRCARLCAYLRPRVPATRITPAVFVYRVTAADLTAALLGPPPLDPDPTIKGLAKIPAYRLDFLR